MATGGGHSELTGANSTGEIDFGPRRSTNTCFGLRKTFEGLTCAEKAFCINSSLNIVAALALSIIQFFSVIFSGNAASADFSFSLLLIVNGGFAAFYAVHGLLREKTYELFAFVLATLLLLVYCIVDIAVNVEGRSGLKWVRLCIAIYLSLSNFVFTCYIVRNFGKISVILAGALEWKQDVHKTALLFFTALIVDAQIAVSFMILVLKDGTSVDWLQLVALLVGIPYSTLWYIIAYTIVKKQQIENVKCFVGIGVVKLLFFIGFLIYKTVKICHQNPDTDTEKEESGCVIEYSRIVAGVCGIFIWILIVVVIKKLSKHFGQGLEPIVFDVSQNTENTGILQPRGN